MASSALVTARDRIMRLQAATKRAREKSAEVVETVITAGEVAGAAFAFGLWEGRVDDPKHFEVAGIPAPLLTGVAAHAFALFGVGRNMESHFHSLGNGALAAHLNGIGRRMGAESKAKKGLATPKIKGEVTPGRAGTGITEADLANLAAI